MEKDEKDEKDTEKGEGEKDSEDKDEIRMDRYIGKRHREKGRKYFTEHRRRLG